MKDNYNIYKKYDCDKAQGYFISRPLNEEVAFEFLQAFKQTKKGLWGKQKGQI